MEYQLEERRQLECEFEIQYRQFCGAPKLPPPFFIIGEKEKEEEEEEEEERVSYIQILWPYYYYINLTIWINNGI